mmetsp:Transcript_5796/g.11418  ORF Transcript_5796/g.11418 Transcript_5796/m.11418 type:complete len:246 (-) Transcript_5796:355-1092(-)
MSLTPPLAVRPARAVAAAIAGVCAAGSSSSRLVAPRSLSSVAGSRYTVATRRSSSPTQGMSRSSSANCSAITSRSSVSLPLVLRAPAMSSGARHSVSRVKVPISTKGRSTRRQPNCCSTALRFLTPFFSRILASIVEVRHPEQKIKRKTGTKIRSMSRFPNCPHVHAKSSKFLGITETSLSSRSTPHFHPSLTSRRRSLEQNFGRRMIVMTRMSITTSVILQKTMKNRSTRSKPNDSKAAPYQPP